MSNFYPCPVEYEGLKYTSSEAAYQAAKTTDKELRQKFTLLDATHAKQYGRSIPLRSDWEEVKDKIMEDIVRAKFTQNYHLTQRLCNTVNSVLIEGNDWHDNYWGVCHCEKCQQHTGANKLGQILMKVRAELNPIV